MNITELARRLKITPAKLREIMPQLGFDIGEKAIKVDNKTAQAILQKLSNPKVKKQYLEKQSVINFQQITQNKDDIYKKEEKNIMIPERIVVKELARRMNLPIATLILELIKNGVMASLNQEVDYDIASIIAEDLGFVPKKSEESLKLVKEVDYGNLLKIEKDRAKPRPPVVVVMGHVDHGKTKLLDAIRKTNIIDTEAGGITQHIGAYQVEKNGRILTFIDTPGHEAFSAMRSRGAQVADLAILIVAADDGVQPQTIEAVAHIRQAKLPFIVAINKIDKTEANIDKVKSDLAKINLTPEDWGGKTICIPISAKQNLYIDELLETLFLVVDMEQDKIMADPQQPAVGTIIEAKVDKGEGPVATVLVQNGTLKLNDLIMINNCPGKIRSMRNWRGETVKEAGPSMPVRILGLKDVPQVGEILKVIKDRKIFKKINKAKKHKDFLKNNRTVTLTKPVEEENKEENKSQINIILKTDVLGTAEAIIEQLDKIKQDKLKINIIKQGLGNITEKDIENAVALKAYLIAFHVKLTGEAKKIMNDKKVVIKFFDVIYDLIDFIEEEKQKLIGKEKIIKKMGKFKILKIFKKDKKWQIVGGIVLEGKIILNSQAIILRQGKEIGQLKIVEIESARAKVNELINNQEAGIKIESKILLEVNDELIVYNIEEV